MIALRIFDQTNARDREPSVTLQLVSERITVKELIERRVRAEVERFKESKGDIFRGLVQPGDTEKTLNGFRFKQPKAVDWRKQADSAIEAFENGRIFLLIDDGQVDDIDEQLTVTAETEVIFLKLVPIIGG